MAAQMEVLRSACPHCESAFEVTTGTASIRFLPTICKDCGGIFLLHFGAATKPSAGELDALEKSPCWDVLRHFQRVIRQRLALAAARLN